jgi:hypothetical protein
LFIDDFCRQKEQLAFHLLLVSRLESSCGLQSEYFYGNHSLGDESIHWWLITPLVMNHSLGDESLRVLMNHPLGDILLCIFLLSCIVNLMG